MGSVVRHHDTLLEGRQGCVPPKLVAPIIRLDGGRQHFDQQARIRQSVVSTGHPAQRAADDHDVRVEFSLRVSLVTSSWRYSSGVKRRRSRCESMTAPSIDHGPNHLQRRATSTCSGAAKGSLQCHPALVARRWYDTMWRLGLLALLLPMRAQTTSQPVFVATLDGPVVPVVEAYLTRTLAHCQQEGGILVLRLDTPGGLVETTRNINREFWHRKCRWYATCLPVMPGRRLPDLCLAHRRHGTGHASRLGHPGRAWRRDQRGHAGQVDSGLAGLPQESSRVAWPKLRPSLGIVTMFRTASSCAPIR